MTIPIDDTSIFQRFDLGQLPIGVYCVTPDGRLVYGNRPLRLLLDLSPDGPLNANAADFYADRNHRITVLNKAIAAESAGRYLAREVIHLRVKGRDRYVEDYCKPLRDSSTHEIVAYVGCLVDVTAEHEAKQNEEDLRAKVHELTTDIGRVLHANTSTLLMVKQTLDGAALALGSKPFKDLGVPLFEDLDAALGEQTDRLAGAIERLLSAVSKERRGQALPIEQWDVLAAQVSGLRKFRERIPVPELRAPTLRTLAHHVVELGGDIVPGVLPREPVRELIREAQQLERLTSLVAVLNTRLAVIQMDLTLRTLRDFVTSDVRQPEEIRRVPIRTLIQEAIVQMAEYARSSRVEIHWPDQDVEAEVKGSERDLIRVLSNLLHNAIKYTWRRDRTRSPWVSIRLKRHEQQICIEFENWGVPVSQSELREGLIFQLGYRGKWATDRGRLGTGIGLTDAQRVARAHGGEIQVESKPTHHTTLNPNDDAYYRQPFLTTVTLCLPLASEH